MEAEQRVQLALSVPLVAALGVQLLDPARPSAGVWLPVGSLSANGAGGAHASALSAVLELAGYLALAPALADDEHAVSHAVALQLIGPAPAGSQVRATGQLDRRGRRSAFVTAVAQVDDVVVARAQITKTVVPWG
ncbi:PaaI family thioesterase [Klenkia sp. PcliD-1-E]|uniref:PaaI family thioesterase n=1 Tax=Klenkia sp. PcliD-1-E TaxID=2954492 RepID=UPI00209729DD|nr:PaaI family thioesterase [Klenkia sp. PcliD-1-E]MCO7218574.1 PaaI family thioesterase [Klenkia sp. PcliD-1-E]